MSEPEDPRSRCLVYAAGYGIMEVVEDFNHHFGGRKWVPPGSIHEIVAQVDNMIEPLTAATLRARELIIRSENPDDPDLEHFQEDG